MSLRADLLAACRKAGGSHLTRQARAGVVERFSKYLTDNNIQIKAIGQIKEKYIRAFLSSRNVIERVKQNELSALRVTLRSAGRELFANKLETQKMGVGKASRDGTHRAIKEGEYQRVLDAAREKDVGVAAVLELSRAFGLRSKEAVIADKATLARWERELRNMGRIEVISGTKGGRPRLTYPASLANAQSAIQVALKVANQNSGHLISSGELKTALWRFHRIAAESGLKGEISPHSLRYAYACDRVETRLAEGFSRREAFVATSLDLGHGDGRGAYIAQVYSRK